MLNWWCLIEVWSESSGSTSRKTRFQISHLQFKVIVSGISRQSPACSLFMRHKCVSVWSWRAGPPVVLKKPLFPSPKGSTSAKEQPVSDFSRLHLAVHRELFPPGWDWFRGLLESPEESGENIEPKQGELWCAAKSFQVPAQGLLKSFAHHLDHMPDLRPCHFFHFLKMKFKLKDKCFASYSRGTSPKGHKWNDTEGSKNSSDAENTPEANKNMTLNLRSAKLISAMMFVGNNSNNQIKNNI